MRATRIPLRWLMAVGIVSGAESQPQHAVLNRPGKYTEVTAASQSDYSSGGATLPVVPWFGWSDRDGNQTYDFPDPERGQAFRKLSFLQRLYVMAEHEEYVRVVSDPNISGRILSKAARDFGWIHKSKMLSRQLKHYEEKSLIG